MWAGSHGNHFDNLQLVSYYYWQGTEDTASSGGIVCHIRNRAAHHRQKPHCPAQRWREFSMFPPTYSDFDYAGVGTDVNCERVKL